MAAAAAAPIAVRSPTAPATPDRPVILPAACPLVVNTPPLPWQPVAAAAGGGGAEVSLPTHRMIKAFGALLRISRAQADIVAAQNVHPMNLALTSAMWSRYLTALQTAGFATSPLATDDDIAAELAQVSLQPASVAEIQAGDWALGQSHNPPAGQGAAAVATRRSLTGIRFLSLATVDLLEVAGAQPWTAVSLLVGLLGPSLTQASRVPETSQVQLVASVLKTRFTAATSDGVIAHGLRATLEAARLPSQLRSESTDPATLLEELQDGFLYRSDLSGRALVEEKRIFLLSSRRGMAHNPGPKGRRRRRQPLPSRGSQAVGPMPTSLHMPRTSCSCLSPQCSARTI